MQKSANGWTVLSCSQGYLPREAILAMEGVEISTQGQIASQVDPRL
jgi:hypothetical protein